MHSKTKDSSVQSKQAEQQEQGKLQGSSPGKANAFPSLVLLLLLLLLPIVEAPRKPKTLLYPTPPPSLRLRSFPLSSTSCSQKLSLSIGRGQHAPSVRHVASLKLQKSWSSSWFVGPGCACACALGHRCPFVVVIIISNTLVANRQYRWCHNLRAAPPAYHRHFYLGKIRCVQTCHQDLL